MQKVLIVYAISSRGAVVPANSFAEVENYPPTAKELMEYEKELAKAGGFDGAVITNVIPLREERT